MYVWVIMILQEKMRNTMDLDSLGNCDWTCVDWNDWDHVSALNQHVYEHVKLA